MSVQLGSVAPVGFEDFADPQWLKTLGQLGCTTAQVYRNRNANDATHSWPVSIAQIHEYLGAADLPCDSLHGVYGSDLDPSSPDERFRGHTVAAFKGEAQLALALEAPLVVVHCSNPITGDLSSGERAVRMGQLRKTIDELADYGQQVGVRFAFENLPGYHPLGNDVGELAAILQHVDSPAAGMCFDVAHANLVGDPVEALRQTRGTMIYAHLCDNNGKSDDHLMPFTGQIDWNGIADAIAELEYSGVLMLECFRPLDELLRLRDEGYGEKLADFLARARGEKE